MSNKKYRLLKDLPGKPAGILLSYSATLKMYQYEGYPSVDMGDGYFVYGELPALVENNPDWFQEVVEPEPPVFVWTDEAVKAYVGTLLGETVQDMNYFKEQWAKKQSKQPFTQAGQEVVEPERVSVELYGKRVFFTSGEHSYTLITSSEVPAGKFSAIKQVIEAVLNGEVLYSIEDVRGALHGEWGTGNAVDNVLFHLRNYKK